MYSSTIIDIAKKLNPYQRDITIELTNDRSTKNACYAAIKTILSESYVKSIDWNTRWYGNYGSK